MARKKKQQKILKKILIIGGALVVVQVVFIIYFSQENPTRTIRNEITEKVKALPGLSPERREKMRVQLALDDYRSKKGKFPKSLSDLTPEYFDSIPRDPATGKPFVYALDGKRYVLGQQAQKPSGQVVISEDGGPPSEEEQTVLIASLESPVDESSFVYDPAGKRDPFQPFDFSIKSNQDCKAHPLTCFDLGQLRFSSYLKFGDEPRAMVDDASGIGHPARIGTKIGRNDGEVVEILADKIVVVERLVDVTGQVTTRVVNLPLQPKVEGKLPRSGARRRK